MDTPGEPPCDGLYTHDLYGVYATDAGDPHPSAVVLNFANSGRTGNVAVKDVRKWVAWMKHEDIHMALMVSRARLNFCITKEVAALEGVIVSSVTTAQLAIDPTQSVYYVPHVRLGAAQAAQVKRQYGESALPVLHTSDPVVRFFGWNVGDVVQVCRNYGGCEFTPTFRMVREV